MSKLDYSPAPPSRREVELEARPLYQYGSQAEACRWSGEDEGLFSKQIDPENNDHPSKLFKLIAELYGDSFADRKLRSEGRTSNIVWGKVAILTRYAEAFTGCERPTPPQMRGLITRLTDTFSAVMQQLPELSYSEQIEVGNRLVRVANELVNAATAFRDGLRFNGMEDADERRRRSEHC